MLSQYSDIFVIGGSGFTGKRIIANLTKSNAKVYALARTTETMETLLSLNVRPIFGSLDDNESISEFLSKSHNPETSALVFVASMGQHSIANLIKLLEKYEIKRTIFTSTTSIYTNLPVESKGPRLEAEQLVKESNLNWTILRPTMIYGDIGDRNFERLIRYISKVRFPVLPLFDGGNALQQPVHVEDLADVYMKVLDNVVSISKAYDIGGPVAITLREAFDAAATAIGKHPRYVNLASNSVIPLLRIYELLTSHPKIKIEQIRRISEDKNVDISEAASDLKYSPRTFLEGITNEAKAILNRR